MIPRVAGTLPSWLRRWRWVGVGEIPDSHRWDSAPKIRFAPDSTLEGTGFEPSVPREAPGILLVSVLVRADSPRAGNQA
jgi:hypothetical protein